jgi:hypothetical protein
VPTRLTIVPARIVLEGRYTDARVIVEAAFSDGGMRDVSRQARLRLLDPRIATVDQDGFVRPLRNGATEITATLGGLSARVPVEVRGIAGGPPRFVMDVVPVLTRTGCNMGGCHGAAQGKGGFRLSLQGFDPEFDHTQITRATFGRRIVPADPGQSLLLRKPSLAVAHRGGLRLKRGSPSYQLLRDWIAAGAPGPDAAESAVASIEVLPARRTLRVGEKMRLRVIARYANGKARDVTSQALFSASDEAVAVITPDGEATATGPGEGALLVRYQSLVAFARVVSPFGPPLPAAQPPLPAPGTESWSTARIDRFIASRMAALGLPASPRCSDTDFLRRASLDIAGVLPSPEEVRAFLADSDPQKREKLVLSLLERPEYVDFWVLRWADVLRSSRRLLGEKGVQALNGWIRQAVARNVGWDQLARELLLAEGSAFENGPANFLRASADPLEMAENTSQVFLGVRMQCAKCHNHPYEKWTMQDYYRLAAFFAQTRARPGPTGGELVLVSTRHGEVQHPKTGARMVPAPLDGQPLDAAFAGNRREALAEWLTSPRNPFFARVFVNRMWKHFFGRGLVEPVDDLRATNPPSHPELLDFLSEDFARNGYDVKRLIRVLTGTAAYHRSAAPLPGNARDTRFLSRYPFKRLGAEQLADALAAATGTPTPFEGLPTGIRAAQLPDTAVPSYFLDLFGRPARSISCECERQDAPNIGQILHLMNNRTLSERIAAKEGRLASLLDSGAPNAKIVEELYLAAFSRPPTPEEREHAVGLLARAKERRHAAEDLFWALLNSREFLFNH